MFAAGRTHREIGAVIGRSTEAVRLKLNYIGSGRDEGKDGGPRCQERMVSGGPCGLLLPCAGPHHTTAHAAQARKGVEW
jgi:hypothetical protein